MEYSLLKSNENTLKISPKMIIMIMFPSKELFFDPTILSSLSIIRILYTNKRRRSWKRNVVVKKCGKGRIWTIPTINMEKYPFFNVQRKLFSLLTRFNEKKENVIKFLISKKEYSFLVYESLNFHYDNDNHDIYYFW